MEQKVFQTLVSHGILVVALWAIIKVNALHDAKNAVGVFGYACGTCGGFLLFWSSIGYHIFPWILPWWMTRVYKTAEVFQVRSIGWAISIIGIIFVFISMTLLPFDDSWAPPRQQGGIMVYLLALGSFFGLIYTILMVITTWPMIICLQITRDGIYLGPVQSTSAMQAGKFMDLENFREARITSSEKYLFIKEFRLYGNAQWRVEKAWTKRMEGVGKIVCGTS